VSTPTISTDLLSLVEDALWFVLESHPDFARLFKGGNRIKFTAGDPDPGKSDKLDADAPEVRLIQTGPQNPQRQTSSATNLDLSYALEMMTTAQTTNRTGALNECLWAAIRAFRAWGDTVADVPEIKSIRVGPVQTAQEQTDGNGGWQAAAQIVVSLHIENADSEVAAWPQ